VTSLCSVQAKFIHSFQKTFPYNGVETCNSYLVTAVLTIYSLYFCGARPILKTKSLSANIIARPEILSKVRTF